MYHHFEIEGPRYGSTVAHLINMSFHPTCVTEASRLADRSWVNILDTHQVLLIGQLRVECSFLAPHVKHFRYLMSERETLIMGMIKRQTICTGQSIVLCSPSAPQFLHTNLVGLLSSSISSKYRTRPWSISVSEEITSSKQILLCSGHHNQGIQ